MVRGLPNPCFLKYEAQQYNIIIYVIFHNIENKILILNRRRKLEEVAKHETLPPHPNCVTFYRAWEERQRLYIQTELCKIRYEIVSIETLYC